MSWTAPLTRRERVMMVSLGCAALVALGAAIYVLAEQPDPGTLWYERTALNGPYEGSTSYVDGVLGAHTIFLIEIGNASISCSTGLGTPFNETSILLLSNLKVGQHVYIWLDCSHFGVRS